MPQEELSIQVAQLAAHLQSELGTPSAPGNIHRTLDDLKSEMRSLRKVIVGNGLPGMVTRLDRLEQSEKGRRFWLSSLAVASIGLACKSLWEVITGRG